MLIVNFYKLLQSYLSQQQLNNFSEVKPLDFYSQVSLIVIDC